MPTWREPRLVNGLLLWLEARPKEGGRTTLLARRAGHPAPPRELTPAPWNLRSRLHGYGGGAFCAEGMTVVFVHDGDRQLWCLDLSSPDTPLPAPRRLTSPPSSHEEAFADGLVDARRHRWLGVREENGHDQLVTVSLAGGSPRPLHRARDFCGSPVLSPTGSHLAWLEWQQPSMPWERSQLWLGRFDSQGDLADVRCLAGANGEAAKAESIVEPLWVGSDLLAARDGSGWWTLTRFANAERCPGDCSPQGESLLAMEADFGVPRWVAGQRCTAWDGERLVAAACRQGRWELGSVEGVSDTRGHPGQWRRLNVPFTDLADLSAENGRLVAIASGPTAMAGLLELDLRTEAWIHSTASPNPLSMAAISTPEALWFKGGGGEPTHAWFYPPIGGADADSPLLIRAHSGPTAMAGTGLNLVVQFWTSRGWGVVDVNYGGSSGFGRAYRERLNGQWGVLDVEDCLAAAEAVVASGRGSASRVAMEGGSASGFTVLAALAAGPGLGAGACRYPVVDLESLAREGHRFEAHYLDSLVGPLPQARATYQARSPLEQVARIHQPVILFHGLDDQVVPPSQSERMALALGKRGVPVELHLFPGEGHGFRNGAVQAQVLEATEAFFRRHLGLGS
ncbi:MAG: prolyl oligopeptidase family serine peptidase [Cyanobacteriota bacterium]|nr:prolyl oligopeptidase family serine peptidase [Cyanobacteriota bacterium]